MPHPRSTRLTGVPRTNAFSLIELLAVMAILVIMLSLLAPVISTFTSSAGRKGAVNTVMNTMEQARAAALTSGADVYVLLWRREFPDKDALIVLREPLDWNRKRDGTQENTLVPMSKWILVPDGVLLHNPDKGQNIFKAGIPSKLQTELSGSPSQVPPLGGKVPDKRDLGVVWYRPTGSIQQPLSTDARIIITEGVRGVGGAEAVIKPKGVNGSFDVISLSRFTGRPQLDVSTIN